MNKSSFITFRFLLALVFFAFSYLAQAQSPNILSPSYQNSNGLGGFTYGGNVGINYNTYGFGLDLSPRLGYKITNDLEIAAIVNGSLHHTEYYRNLSLSVGPALSYYLGRVVYLTTSYQHYFVSQKSKLYNNTYNTEEDALYVGGGYMQQLGDNVYLQIGATYNVLYKSDSSIFSTGFVPNIGIVIGL